MRKIILVSGDRKTQEAVRAGLPKGAVLEEAAALGGLLRPHETSAEGKYAGTVILVDCSGEPIPAGRLEPFTRAGIPLIALLDSPDRREDVFRAGFDDYLLRPILPEEWTARLRRLARAPEEALERDRQAAVGRLTSYFCHAVNNSMQTIRGAVDLAREEPDLPAEVAEYLAICRRETELIGKKIDRLRQIYRPKASPPEPIQLEAAVREALKMAADDLLRNNVAVKELVEASLPVLHVSPDKIILALLLILFHLGAEMGARGGGELRVQVERGGGNVRLRMDTAAGAGAPGSAVPLPPGLEPARELIRSERGQIQAAARDGGFSLQVSFPAGGGS
ncbi:MAG: hypothetical protein JW929_08445 [Anaerolineales bacterium]|nr:hypothetical protein [Anaerolineales bacterium]